MASLRPANAKSVIATVLPSYAPTSRVFAQTVGGIPRERTEPSVRCPGIGISSGLADRVITLGDQSLNRAG